MKIILSLLLATSLYSLDFSKVIEEIKHHEGFRSSPYKDSGHLSVGYGTNLSHVTRAEAQLLLVHRLSIRLTQLNQHQWFKRLNATRQQVILNMTYQMGYAGILKFKHMVWRLENGYYLAASNSMVDSKWYRQSGSRSKQLVKLMREGK